MEIKTITCHDVYNHGASLQEYALLKFLEHMGHDAETIQYKPEYLCDRYNFWYVGTPKYKKYILTRFLYILLKTPEKLVFLKRKNKFDKFSLKHIKSTTNLYRNNEELKNNLPKADAYICGSDQIWNSFFENGKDPAFYLDFVPKNKLKLSYAASFAIDKLDENIKDFVRQKVLYLDYVSVRESSGIRILEGLNFKNVALVLDPVFLIGKNEWVKLESNLNPNEDYIFVYDFDSNPLMQVMAEKIKKQINCKIFTVNKNISYADKNYYSEGPDSFLTLIKNAKFILSNSFHAVAFSIIFQKDFVVFNRMSNINTRMRDLLNSLDLIDVLILNQEMMNKHQLNKIDYNSVSSKLTDFIYKSKMFLKNALKN